MVEENGNSSLDQLGESASVHNNTDDNSTHQSQQSQLSSSLHHQQQQQQQDASPSGAILASSANIVQFIPTQSVQVNWPIISISRSHHIFMRVLVVCVCWKLTNEIFVRDPRDYITNDPHGKCHQNNEREK